jgi:hypothetical protein
MFVLTDNMESGNEEFGEDYSDTSSAFEVSSHSEIVEDATQTVEDLMYLDALYDTSKEGTSFYKEESVAKAVVSLAKSF